MSSANPILLGVGGLVVLVAVWLLAAHFFSEEAKQERRRRRSNAPIATKVRRPMVKLFAKTKNDKPRKR